MMASSSALVSALFNGVFETPLWQTFLALLRQETGADFAILLFLPPGRPLHEVLYLVSGEAPKGNLEEVFRQLPKPVSGKVDTSAAVDHLVRDPIGDGSAAHAEFYRDLLSQYGIAAARQLRVREPTGIEAYLTIVRSQGDFTPNDVVLLEDLAPVLAGVLQLYVALERERFAADLTAEAVRSLQFGWLTLAGDGRVLNRDEYGGQVLATSGILGVDPSGRLTASRGDLQRDIYRALGQVAENPNSRPRAVTLSQEPWLDMLIVPARRQSLTSPTAPVAVAYVHGDSWRSADRCEQLAELFGLQPREARMALALSRGLTLAEAAQEFGLTIGTARSYSKLIYAKTGARGLPDLVRIVMRSVLAFGS